MANTKRDFGNSYKNRQISYAVRKRSTSYFDFLRGLTDEELRNEYRKVYSHSGDATRKQILNRYLLDNKKLDIIG